MLKVVKEDESIIEFKPANMLEYVKTILIKVSFDIKLFEKELKKAIKTLIKEEIQELKKWCYKKFGKTHAPVLQKCFVAY